MPKNKIKWKAFQRPKKVKIVDASSKQTRKLAKAVASTKNVKPVFAGHPYFEAEFEKFWEGTHIFGLGTIRPGFYDQLKKDLEKMKKKDRRLE